MDHFGFICRESSENGGFHFVCYVFQCTDEALVSERKERPIVILCSVFCWISSQLWGCATVLWVSPVPHNCSRLEFLEIFFSFNRIQENIPR